MGCHGVRRVLLLLVEGCYWVRCGLLRGSMWAVTGLDVCCYGSLWFVTGFDVCYGSLWAVTARCGMLRGSMWAITARVGGESRRSCGWAGRGHGAPGGGRLVRFLVELDASAAVGAGRAGGAARMGGGGYRRQTGLLLLVVVVALSGLHHSQVSALPKRTGEVRLPYMLLADVFQTISAT